MPSKTSQAASADPTAPALSVVIPVYDEAALIEGAVEQVLAALSPTFPDHELILVESGSTDGSDVACDALARRFPGRVRVIHEGRRNGFGAALRCGYAAARGELVSMITADLPFPLDTFARALPALEGHDCVLSWRASDPRGRHRRLQSWVYNALVRTLLRVPVRHVNSAFKLYRRELIQDLPLTENGWLHDAEVVAYLVRRGKRWAELPVPLIDRTAGRSSVGLGTPFRMLGQLLRLARHLAAAEPATTVATAVSPASQSSSSRSSSATCCDSTETCSRRNSSKVTSLPSEPATFSSSSR